MTVVIVSDHDSVFATLRDEDARVGRLIAPHIVVTCGGFESCASAFAEFGCSSDFHFGQSVDRHIHGLGVSSGAGEAVDGLCGGCGNSVLSTLSKCDVVKADALLSGREIIRTVPQISDVACGGAGQCGVERDIVADADCRISNGGQGDGRLDNGEVQRHHRVTTRGVGGRPSRGVGACGIGEAMPFVAFAGGHSFSACSAVIDGEVQRHYRVATCCVGERVDGTVVAFGISEAINPGVAVAGFLSVGTGGAVFDGQIQGDDGIAAVDVCTSESVRVFAAFRDSLSVPIEGFAGCLFVSTCCGKIHGDGEGLFSCGGTGDIVGGQRGGGDYVIFVGLRWVDGDGITRFLRVPSVGHISVVAVNRSGEFRASVLTDGIVAADGQRSNTRFEDGEVQCNQRVATRGIDSAVCRRVVAFGIGLAVPIVAVAGGHSFGAGTAVVDGQMQCHHTVHAA